MSWEKEVMECLGFLRKKAFSLLSLSATHLFPKVFFSYVSCLPYLCQLKGSWHLVYIVQHGREPRSSWELFCRHTSESQNHTSSVHMAPSGENHALLYFHCLLSVSLHTESQTLLIWTKWIWKNRKMLFLKIFSSYLIPNLCFSKTKNNVANSQPIRKNQPQMSSLFDMWIIFLHRFTLKKIF